MTCVKLFAKTAEVSCKYKIVFRQKKQLTYGYKVYTDGLAILQLTEREAEREKKRERERKREKKNHYKENLKS